MQTAARKKWAFRQRLKEGRTGDNPISIGIEFKTEGTENLKARLPNSVRHLGIFKEVMTGGA